MMEIFDVIIVGGGPAGLQCAWVLSGSSLKVLLVEKNRQFGEKVCAGGITRKDLEILDLPDHLLEQKVSRTAIHSPLNKSKTQTSSPFVFTIDQLELGAWMRERLSGTPVNIITNTRVTRVTEDRIVTEGNTEYGYRYLVGADGYGSVVRRYIGLPVRHRLVGIQYRIPMNGRVPWLEMYLHSGFFHSWYAWSFPHRDTFGIGVCFDPRKVSTKTYTARFERWVRRMGIDPDGASRKSAPISYDYRGHRFGRIFLTGDAGGFASGLTGEGIYQALVSGEAAARKILDPGAHCHQLEAVIRYNRIQRKVMKAFYYSGPFRFVIHELLILILNFGPVKKRLNDAFTKATPDRGT